MPVPFTRIGDLAAKMRKHRLQPSKKLKNNIRELDLEHIISFSELKGERYLTINMQVLLPNPGNSVKDLLPGVTWPPVTGPPCTSHTSHSTSNLETVIPAKTTAAGGSGSGSSSSRNQAAAASSATPLVAQASSMSQTEQQLHSLLTYGRHNKVSSSSLSHGNGADAETPTSFF